MADPLVTLAELAIINPAFARRGKGYEAAVKQLQRHKGGSSGKWVSVSDPRDNNTTLINYDSIPADFKEKHSLPVSYAELRTMLAEKAKETGKAGAVAGGALRTSTRLLQKQLEAAVANNYTKHISAYRLELPKTPKKAEAKAKDHSLLVAICKAKAEGCKVAELWEACQGMFQVKKFSAYNVFSSFVKEWETGAIKQNLLHGHQGRSREDLVKLTVEVKAIIDPLLASRQKISNDIICQTANRSLAERGLEPISLSTVKRYAKQNRNMFDFARSNRAYKLNMEPILRRKKAEFAGDLMYIDGSSLQIPCYDEKQKKVIQASLYVAMDAHSGKIVGHCLSETENRWAVFTTLREAVVRGYSMHMPAEIVGDHGPATQSKEWHGLVERAHDHVGCTIRLAPVGRPQAKAGVERFFGVMESRIQRHNPLFLGFGATSYAEHGKIDSEHLKEMKKLHGIRTLAEMTLDVAEMIMMYNADHVIGKQSPNEKFAASEKPNLRPLRPEQVPLLFWHERRERLVRNSEVKLQINNKNYYYGITNLEDLLELNGKEVMVRYSEDELDTIYLYSQHGEYLGEMKQKYLPAEAQVNQTELDKKHIMGSAANKKAIEAKGKRLVEEKVRKGIEIAEQMGQLALYDTSGLSKSKINEAEMAEQLAFIADRHGIKPEDIRPAKSAVPVPVPVLSDADRYLREQQQTPRKKGSLKVLDI